MINMCVIGHGDRRKVKNSPKVHSCTDFSMELIDKAVSHEADACLQRLSKQSTSLQRTVSCAERENTVWFIEKCAI